MSEDEIEEAWESVILKTPIREIVFYQYVNFDKDGNVKWE